MSNIKKKNGMFRYLFKKKDLHLDCPRAGPEDRGPRSDLDRPCRSGGPGQKLADRPPVKRARARTDLSKVIYTDQQ